MRHNHKKGRSVTQSTTLMTCVVFSAVVWCRNVGAVDDANEEEWTAGAPVPGMPHVITGAEEGRYLPVPGWRFVNDTQDDFTVEPLPAKDAMVPAWGKDLKIPAPEGFWTLEDEHPLAKLLALQADGDTENKTIEMWARTESGLWNDIQCACVKVTRAFYDKRVSLSAFEIAREAMRKEYEGLSRKFIPAANKMAESISREATNLAETNISVSVDDVRFLPPHAVGRDRICFTVIRKENNDIGGEKSTSYSVTSGAMLWIRGTVFNLYINYGVVEKEIDVEAATIATREKISKWIASVEMVNDRAYIDDEDAMARTDPNCIKQDNPEKSGSSWSPNWGKIVLWAVIGSIWGLVSSVFKKKKKS